METYKSENSKTFLNFETPIEVKWEKFQPALKPSLKDSVIIYLPGWSIAPKSYSVVELCREIAKKCDTLTLAVQTRPEEPIGDSLLMEAKAINLFLEEMQTKLMKRIILVAHSQGTVKAIYLAELLEKRKSTFSLLGVIIATPVGLYPLSNLKLQLRFLGEAFKVISHGVRELTTERKYGSSAYLTKSVLATVRQDITHEPKTVYTKRIRNQTNELSRVYHKIIVKIKKIKAPVVLLLAEKDLVSIPKNIRSTLQKNRLKNIHLKIAKNVSHSLPYMNISLVADEVKKFLQ